MFAHFSWPPSTNGARAGVGGASLRVGGRVELTGLKSAVQLNGARGVLVEYKEGEGRWLVKLDPPHDAEHERMTVKPANMTSL